MKRIPQTLLARRCDAIVGLFAGDERIVNRSSYSRRASIREAAESSSTQKSRESEGFDIEA